MFSRFINFSSFIVHLLIPTQPILHWNMQTATAALAWHAVYLYIPMSCKLYVTSNPSWYFNRWFSKWLLDDTRWESKFECVHEGIPTELFCTNFCYHFEHVLIKDIFLVVIFLPQTLSVILQCNNLLCSWWITVFWCFLLFKNAGILDRAWTIVVKLLTLLLLYFAQWIVMLFSFQEVVSWEDSVEVSSYNSHIAALLAEMVNSCYLCTLIWGRWCI